MGPFPSSFNNFYILLSVDYVSKCVEAIPTRTNDASVVVKFLHSHIYTVRHPTSIDHGWWYSFIQQAG